MIKLPEKIENDIHMHSSRSRCGQNDYFVLFYHANRIGLRSIAVTDHGPDSGGLPIPETFLDYERTPGYMEGVRIFRGIEANVRNDGTTDVPEEYKKKLDIVLLGFHETAREKSYCVPPENPSLLLSAGRSEENYTDLLIKAIDSDVVDLITHPQTKKFPICMDAVVEACKEKGIALGLNNSNFALKRKYNPKKTEEMIKAINRYAPRIAIVSDAHCYIEMGYLEGIKTVLAEYPIEADVELVNATLESTEKFIEERKELRQK